MTDEIFVAARRSLVEEARALLANERSVPDFFRAFMSLVRHLAGDDGLDGVDLEVFKLLEAWEESVGPSKARAETALRVRLKQFVPPARIESRYRLGGGALRSAGARSGFSGRGVHD